MTESISRTEPSSRHHFEYTSEQELLSEFCKHMSDPKNVDIAANYLYQSLLDESILGVVFEVHHLIKSGMLDALEGEPEDSKEFAIVDLPDLDVFGSTVGKKAIDCTCPNCDRLVSTSRFAPHLEKCMGKLQCQLNTKGVRINFWICKQEWVGIRLASQVDESPAPVKEAAVSSGVMLATTKKLMLIGQVRSDERRSSRPDQMAVRKTGNPEKAIHVRIYLLSGRTSCGIACKITTFYTK